jgi:hypothetical protein
MTIEGLPERWKAEETLDMDGLVDGWLIEDRWFETLHHVSLEAMAKLNLKTLADVTAAGKNVTQITRITGYFSPVANWNKGKRAELKDRARVKI